jgi:hypothetical protein
MPSASLERPKSVRLLPYVLVPGMDTSSRVFHKALSTIAKQSQSIPTPVSMPSTPVQGTAGGNKNLTASLLNLDNGWHGMSTLAPNACHSADLLFNL